MRKRTVTIAISMLLAVPAFAAETPQPAPVEVGNTLCPVSGEKVGTMGEAEHIEHNGKVYNLCCSLCNKDFNKDPDKYAKIAEDEAKEVVK